MRTWKDESGSSTLEFKALRIVVHHHIHHPEGTWLFSVYGHVSFAQEVLKATTLEAAKDEALRTLFSKLNAYANLVLSAIPDTKL